LVSNPGNSGSILPSKPWAKHRGLNVTSNPVRATPLPTSTFGLEIMLFSGHGVRSSIVFSLDLKRSGLGVGDYLLGAQVAHMVLIRGHDEVGRVVEAKVRF